MSKNWYDASGLPQFDRPPVVETAMALEFAAPANLDGIALVRLQDLWLADYPTLSEAPGAPPTQLAPGDPTLIQFGDLPRRIWAAQPATGLLLQTQLDRIVLNWRKLYSDGPYPGYASLRAEFSDKWLKIRDWISQRSERPVSPHLAEFTYVNQIEIDAGEGLSNLLAFIAQPELELPGSDQLGQFSFVREVVPSPSDPLAAQINFNGQPNQQDGQSTFVFTVTARVLPGSPGVDVLEALDIAHALASHTFAASITPAKQESWGRTK